MVDIPLRRVVRGPDIYVATWRLPDGAIVGHEITAQEYAALALKGAGAPPNRTGNARAVWIGAAQEASLVQQIGKILVLYRPRPEQDAAQPARRGRKKPRFRSKRSYQHR